jgi:Na+/H+ antiporter NhaD/arsenite permease-like protein
MLDSPAFAMVGFFAFVLGMTKVLSDNWTKRKLIEARVSDDVIRTLFRKESDPEIFAALKWGIVLVALGLGLVVSQYLPSGFEEPLAWGVVLVFGGAGLLAYYAIARALVRRDAAETPARPRASLHEHV